jgi:hypothetical protein
MGYQMMDGWTMDGWTDDGWMHGWIMDGWMDNGWMEEDTPLVWYPDFPQKHSWTGMRVLAGLPGR